MKGGACAAGWPPALCSNTTRAGSMGDLVVAGPQGAWGDMALLAVVLMVCCCLCWCSCCCGAALGYFCNRNYGGRAALVLGDDKRLREVVQRVRAAASAGRRP